VEEQNAPSYETLPPQEAREATKEVFRELGGPLAPVSKIENRTLPGPGGNLPIRVYTPNENRPLPVLVYFHGGGWVICDLDTHDAICCALADAAGCLVVSVDYRLSPEHKFPAAPEDAYAVVKWLSENAETISGDSTRIAVGGDSAGGNLSAVVSLMARDRGGPRLVFQLPIYPVTNLASFDTDSYRDFAKGYMLSKAQMEWFRGHYLADEKDASLPYASPLLAKDLSGLPPALVITAEFDVLRDEGEAYAERLKQAGVPVRCLRYDGMIHPFFSLGGVLDRTRAAYEEAAAALREAFAR
jgi:acetyl esterase